MNDPILDKHLEHNRQLLKAWQRFHQFLGECNKPGRVFTPQEENEFIRVKSQIAILYDSYFESLKDPNRESISTAQSMITVVENCILLRQVQRLSPAELKKMEIEWHEAYLLINTNIGFLEEEQTRLAAISYSTHRRQEIVKKINANVKYLLHSKGLHYAVVTAVLFTGLVVLPYLNVFSYDFLRESPITNTVYQYTRHFLRQYLMSDLVYHDWATFERFHPAMGMGPEGAAKGVAGYDVRDIPEDLKAQFTRLFTELIGTRTVVKSQGSTYEPGFKVQYFLSGTNPGWHGALGWTVFEKLSDAKEVAAKLEAGPTQIKDLSTSMQSPLPDFKFCVVGRMANVVYVLRATDEEQVRYLGGLKDKPEDTVLFKR